MSTYSEKLRSPKWQKVRLEVFNRDQWKCVQCGDGSTNLQVHHLEYIGGIEPWDYPKDMLTTYCETCHARETKRPTHETDLITSLKMNGFNSFQVWNLATKLYNDTRFKEHLKVVLSK